MKNDSAIEESSARSPENSFSVNHNSVYFEIINGNSGESYLSLGRLVTSLLGKERRAGEAGSQIVAPPPRYLHKNPNKRACSQGTLGTNEPLGKSNIILGRGLAFHRGGMCSNVHSRFMLQKPDLTPRP